MVSETTVNVNMLRCVLLVGSMYFTFKMLGSPIINSKSGPSQVEPNPNKTQNDKIPITKPNHVPQVTWADIARKESMRKNYTT